MIPSVAVSIALTILVGFHVVLGWFALILSDLLGGPGPVTSLSDAFCPVELLVILWGVLVLSLFLDFTLSLFHLNVGGNEAN